MNKAPNKFNIDSPTNYTLQSACYKAFFEEMMLKANHASSNITKTFFSNNRYTVSSMLLRSLILRHYDANEWFQGVFWWAWWTDPMSGTDFTNLYTPQNKPVLEVIREYYIGRQSNARDYSELHRYGWKDRKESTPYWCGVTQG